LESLERNKSIVREYVAAFNRGDSDALRKLFTSDAQIHGVLGSAPIEQALSIWNELHTAFNLQLNVEEIVAEGDRVVVRYTERGTFRAPFRGKEPTGKSYELTAMEWFAFRNGLIAERWGARDSAAQARQLGI
jgi:steroid delta-isomerase-like uncharacterized protein